MFVLQDLNKASLSEVDRLYGTRETSGLGNDPDACAAVARRALSLGEALLAYDLCVFGLQANPSHPTLRQLQGLALARSGAHEQARGVLEKLYQEGSRDEETLGILARIYKDGWYQAPESSEGQDSLRRSQQLYANAYQSTGGYWMGINAATLACVMGKGDVATNLANKVKRQCIAEEETRPADLWRRATLGEACLLLADATSARGWYVKALEAGAGLGDCASMRRNARLISAATGRDISWLDAVLRVPVVAVLTGHMIDDSTRLAPRFPERIADAAGLALKSRLESAGAQIGYASAASGSDILFHEAMFELGRETHVVLPMPPEQFVTASVGTGTPSVWLPRFHRVLERAASVVVHSGSTSGDIGYAYNNWIVLGLGRVHAKQLEGRVRAFALWDGIQGLPGGSASAVQDWCSFEQEVEWLVPTSSASSTWHLAAAQSGGAHVTRSVGSQRIVSMLFADAVGFSKLPDGSIPAFVQHFLGAVAKTMHRQSEQPLARNTWGDGLYFCFSTPRAAGLFALDLCDEVRATDWAAFGLPASLTLRIALHCGPAHEVIDPVIEQRNFTGAHVSRAARLEPVTPPGSVYSSQSFAALCACENIKEFSCEYVGRMPMAKKYGEHQTFAVRRRR